MFNSSSTINKINRNTQFLNQLKDYFNNNKKERILIRKEHKINLNKYFLLIMIEILKKEIPSIELDFNFNDGIYTLSVFDIVMTKIFFNLYILGLNKHKLERYYDMFYNKDSYRLLEYYIYRSFSTDVKIYFSGMNFEILTDKEFLENDKLSQWKYGIISLNLNDIVSSILGEGFNGNSGGYFVGLDQSIEAMLHNLDNDIALKNAIVDIVSDKDNYDKVSLEKKGGKFDLIRKEFKYDLDSKLVDIAKKYPNSSVRMVNFNGKIQKIVIENKTKASEIDNEDKK